MEDKCPFCEAKRRSDHSAFFECWNHINEKGQRTNLCYERQLAALRTQLAAAEAAGEEEKSNE